MCLDIGQYDVNRTLWTDTTCSVQCVHFQTRWAQLFADLEAQSASVEASDLSLEIADRTRGELAAISLANRLRAQIGARVHLRVLGSAEQATGTLTRVGADWALVAAPADQVEMLIMLDALVAAINLPAGALAESGVDRVTSRLGRGAVLRALARDRAPVHIRMRDGTSVSGTLDRVGADFLDLARHEMDQAPRPAQVRSRWTLAWSAIAMVVRGTEVGP